MRSIRHWPWKLFVRLTDVAFVNTVMLRVLKYPNWQQKKSNQRCHFLLSVGEEMVRPHLKRIANTGNFNRYISSVMRAGCRTSSEIEKKIGGRWCGRCAICLTAKDRKTDWKCYQCSEWVCKDHCVKPIEVTCNRLQGQIII
jgi:hypothetical protein